jgi:predicted SAM-dependent methyltransferase
MPLYERCGGVNRWLRLGSSPPRLPEVMVKRSCDWPRLPTENANHGNNLRHQCGDAALSELKGVYVQYGSGPNSCPPGWINFDISPTLRLQKLPIVGKLFRHGSVIFPDGTRYGDIVNGLPIPRGSADGIYASHVLEHLSLEDCGIALSNTFRLLKHGGIFRLIVPDLQNRARQYLANLENGDVEANSWFMRQSVLGLEHRRKSLEEWARSVLGNSAHLWMWDELSMTAALEKTGFTEIRRCHFNDSRDDAFRLVEERGRFIDETTGQEECAMEATKP